MSIDNKLKIIRLKDGTRVLRIGEFMERSGVQLKTARWLYDNVFHVEDTVKPSQRVFTEEDLKYVIQRKPENFEACFGEKIEYFINDYFVSDGGRVFSLRRGFLEELCYEINAGYRRVNIYMGDGQIKHFKVSRLVAMLYVSNQENKDTVNHIDGNKLNDKYTNLEWVTMQENTQHAYSMGLAKNAKGFDDSQQKPVVMFDNSGNRLGVYGSIREAVRETEYTLGYVQHQAQRGVKHGTQGVYFNFLNEEDKL